MPPRDPPSLHLPPPAPALAFGLADDSVKVEVYFEAFAWDGTAPDPEVLSAEDFLNGLG